MHLPVLTQTFSSIANTHLPSTGDEEPLLSRKLDPRQATFMEHLLNQPPMLSHHFSSLGDHAVENAEGKIRNFVSSLKAAKVSVATAFDLWKHRCSLQGRDATKTEVPHPGGQERGQDTAHTL